MTAAAPTLMVLGGCNGAGKTTAARSLLAETLGLRTFVNADVIAQGLAGFDPDSVALEASRIMLERLRQLAERRENFAFETTLAGRTTAEWLHKVKETRYTIRMVYFWLASADLAVARVAERVRAGGHAIPEDTIRRRYRRSVRNFFNLYRPLANKWAIYDNTDEELPRLIAHGNEASAEMILEETVWSAIREKASP